MLPGKCAMPAFSSLMDPRRKKKQICENWVLPRKSRTQASPTVPSPLPLSPGTYNIDLLEKISGFWVLTVIIRRERGKGWERKREERRAWAGGEPARGKGGRGGEESRRVGRERREAERGRKRQRESGYLECRKGQALHLICLQVRVRDPFNPPGSK